MSYDSTLLALGPVGYWKLADASGSSTVADSSGNGYTGTLGASGIALGVTPGAIPSESSETALSSTGAAYVATTSAPQTSAVAWSTAAWVKTTSNLRIVIAGDRGTGGTGMSLTLAMGPAPHMGAAGTVDFGVDSSGVWVGVATTAAYNDGNWHFIVATWAAPSGTAVTASQFSIYVDGSAVAIGDGSGPAGAATSPLTGSGGERLGDNGIATSGGGWAYFVGDLAQVAIFDTALSATQVTDLWNASQSSPTTGSLLSTTSAEGSLLEAVSGSLGAQSDTQALLDLSLSGRT